MIVGSQRIDRQAATQQATDADIAIMLLAFNAGEHFWKLLAIGDAAARGHVPDQVAKAAWGGIDIGAAMGGPLHIGEFEPALQPHQRLVAARKIIADAGGAGPEMVEIGAGMLGAVCPTAEIVARPRPVIILHIGDAVTGDAAFEPDAEPATKIGRQIAAQHRRAALPDQLAQRFVAVIDELIGFNEGRPDSGLHPHAVAIGDGVPIILGAEAAAKGDRIALAGLIDQALVRRQRGGGQGSGSRKGEKDGAHGKSPCATS